jgi:hypothetical protein
MQSSINGWRLPTEGYWIEHWYRSSHWSQTTSPETRRREASSCPGTRWRTLPGSDNRTRVRRPRSRPAAIITTPASTATPRIRHIHASAPIERLRAANTRPVDALPVPEGLANRICLRASEMLRTMDGRNGTVHRRRPPIPSRLHASRSPSAIPCAQERPEWQPEAGFRDRFQAAHTRFQGVFYQKLFVAEKRISVLFINPIGPPVTIKPADSPIESGTRSPAYVFRYRNACPDEVSASSIEPGVSHGACSRTMVTQ